MAVKLSPFGPKPAFWDSSGNPLSGGKLYFFAAGSTTSQNTYTDSTGGSANTNPVVLNSRGEPPNEIWFTTGLTYKAVLKTSADVTIWSVDNISAINDVTAATADEWLSPGLTPTFISTTSFSLAGDQTTEFHIGRRLKTTNTAGTIYSTITNSVFGALTTVTVKNDSGVLDSGLSAVSYGILRSSNPSIPGKVFVGDNANTGMTLGVTINQGANNDEIAAFKSSNTSHGMTTLAEDDTFGSIRCSAGAGLGGVELQGFGETNNGVIVRGSAGIADTSKNTSAGATVLVIGGVKSGTTVGSIGANGNIIAFRDTTTTRFILDADGDSHQDVGTAWTNFDAFDDVALLDSLSVAISKPDDPIKQQFGEFLAYNREALERAKLVMFNEDGHHFVNMSRLTMLLTGAVRQVGARLAAMEARMLALELK